MEVVGEYLGTTAVSFNDFETGSTTVSVYLEEKPKLDSPKLRALGVALKGRTGGRGAGTAGIFSLQRVRKRDWAESWKEHFKPIQIGSNLLIKPGWSGKRAKKGQKVVVLDPGLSFGTGQHPTTMFCLRELVALAQSGRRLSFLDLGTGSGILAIAAAKLGYAPITALDYDAEAVRIACSNARRNRVLRKIDLHEQDLTKLRRRSGQKYDVVCANLIANVLGEQRGRITDLVQPGGVLVLAGILRTEFRQVSKVYKSLGMKLISQRREREWASGAFRKKKI